MRTAWRAERATLIGLLAGALFAVDALATPADVFGIGPRTQSVGGTGATWDTGSEAAFVNPAALALTRKAELTIGLHDAVFSLDVEGGRAPGRFSTPASSGALLGVLVPLRIGQEPIALALFSRSPADVVAGAHLPYPETPQFPLLANRVQALDSNLALGFALGPRLSVGGGLRALASLGGTVHIAQDPGGRSRAQIEDELTPAYAPSLGARFDPGADFALALVWRAPLRADFDVQIAETDLGAVKLPELNISGVAEYDPAEVHVEVSRQMAGWRLAVALTYRRWSAFPGWLSATTTCPATRPQCGALGADVPVLDDTWVPRAGVSYGFDSRVVGTRRGSRRVLLRSEPPRRTDDLHQHLGQRPTRFHAGLRRRPRRSSLSVAHRRRVSITLSGFADPSQGCVRCGRQRGVPRGNDGGQRQELRPQRRGEVLKRVVRRRARSSITTWWVVCGSLWLASGQSNAGPSEGFGFGARSTALGGAVSADVRDGSAVFYNPAGLSLAPRTELSAGFEHVAYRLDQGGDRARVDSLSVFEAALTARGEIAGIPVAFGLALALPNGHLSKMHSLLETEPHWVLYETLPELVDLGAQVALRPLDGLAFGGGIGFLAATHGGFDVTGTVPLSDGKGSQYDAKLRHEVDADLTSVRFPMLGVNVVPSHWLSLALVYRGEARLEQRIAGTLDGNVDAAHIFQIPVRYSFETTTVAAFLPRQIVVGASVEPLSGLRANVDVAWQEWSRYPSPASSSSTALDAQVPAGLPVNLPGSSMAAPLAQPNFGDRWVPRVGVEYVIGVGPRFGLALRAGYAFERSPAPRDQAASAFVDGDRHIVSWGTGLSWRKVAPWLPEVVRVDMQAQLSEWPSSVIETASTGSSLDVGGSAWCAGASLTFGFE